VPHSGHSGSVAYAFEILLEIELHLHSYAIFEQVLFLFDQFGRKVSKAVFGKLAVSGATEIHLGIQYLMATFVALAPGFILEELDHCPTVGTFSIKDRVKLPESRVLSRAFHCSLAFLPP
jgi:hypothetical protein